MKLTNVLGLPEAIVEAVRNDEYSRGECDISVTQLIAPPRLVELQRLHADEIVEDVADRIWLLMGKIAHGILEKATPEHSALTEERLFIDEGGWKLSGAFDNLALSSLPTTSDDTWKLSDFKVTSVWAAKNAASKTEWVEQLNCYAYMLEQYGFEVHELEIVAICRDWRLNDARRYGGDGYPQHQVAVIKLPLWTSAQQYMFIRDRIAAHKAARGSNVLLYCTPDERWEKPTTWAVMKEGRKSAVRVLDSADLARVHLDGLTTEGQKKGNYRIEERPGVSVRCQDYCSVREFCVARADGQPMNLKEGGGQPEEAEG